MLDCCTIVSWYARLLYYSIMICSIVLAEMDQHLMPLAMCLRACARACSVVLDEMERHLVSLSKLRREGVDLPTWALDAGTYRVVYYYGKRKTWATVRRSWSADMSTWCRDIQPFSSSWECNAVHAIKHARKAVCLQHASRKRCTYQVLAACTHVMRDFRLLS